MRWLIIIVAGLSLASGPAWAWGPDGHRIVARIAEDRLTEHAKAGVSALILPEDDSLADNHICNWPDYIRHDQPKTAPWHFVDIPYDALAYDAVRDCPNGQCVVEQISIFEKIVADAKAGGGDRNRALRFLVHFVGDIHQPLHCISRDNDRGANLRTALYPDDPKETNLHAIWDMNLVRANLGTNTWQEYADILNKRITPAETSAWVKSSPADWANESHALAIKTAYMDVPPVGGPPFEPDAAYIAAARSVVDEQLSKAGVRLAGLLNQAFP